MTYDRVIATKFITLILLISFFPCSGITDDKKKPKKNGPAFSNQAQNGILNSNGKALARRNEFGKGGSKHKQAAASIALMIETDSGRPKMDFEEYSAKLAETIGFLDEAALQRVFKANYSKLP